MARGARRFSRLAVISFALALPGCGGPGVVPSTPTTPTVLTLVTQGSGTLRVPNTNGKNDFLVVPFTTSKTGNVQVTLSWTSPRNNVSASLGAGICTAEQLAVPACPNGRRCPCQLQDVGGVAVFGGTSAHFDSYQTGGGYTLIISNLGPGEDGVLPGRSSGPPLISTG